MAKMRSGIDLYKAASKVGKGAQSGAGGEAEDKKSIPGFVKLTRDESHRLSGDKAAGLMLLLGTDEAAGVLAKLEPTEAEEIARRIALTRRVDAVEAESLLQEFGDQFGKMEARRVRGGVEAARKILTSAFGSEKANEIIARTVPESLPKPLAFLTDLSFSQLSSLLRKENPRTLALVMTYMDPSHASQLLESLPNRERRDVVLRMARTETVAKEVLESVENALQEKLRLMGRDESEEMDGRSALADIMRYMDLGDERRLLGDLAEADPDLAEQVRERLYTMDSVLHLRKRDLQEILRGMEEKEIALLLKGQTPEIRECINSALSSRRRLMVADEGDLMGAVPRRDADAAVKDFLEKIRNGEENGTFIIVREEDDLL